MGDLKADFGRTAEDYGRHRAGFPPRLVDELALLGVIERGHDVADLGTGTGSLARLLAPHVRSVTGIDPSAEMLRKAEELDREAGVTVSYRVATAEDTGLADGGYDLVTAGQCWHWFDAARAAAEVWRLLRPGGSVAIAHFDWIPLPGNVVDATEELIRAHNPSWAMGGGTGLHPRWLTDLALGGFGDIRTFSFDVAVPYSREDWIGRIRASAGVGASLPPEQVERFTEDLGGLLAERYPSASLDVPHRTWAVVATKPRDGGLVKTM